MQWHRGTPLTLSLGLISPQGWVAARGGTVGRDGWASGQAAVRGCCITLGDLERGRGRALPHLRSEGLSGMQVHLPAKAGRAPGGQELGAVSTAQAPTMGHWDHLVPVQETTKGSQFVVAWPTSFPSEKLLASGLAARALQGVH